MMREVEGRVQRWHPPRPLRAEGAVWSTHSVHESRDKRHYKCCTAMTAPYKRCSTLSTMQLPINTAAPYKQCNTLKTMQHPINNAACE